MAEAWRKKKRKSQRGGCFFFVGREKDSQVGQMSETSWKDPYLLRSGEADMKKVEEPFLNLYSLVTLS